jgi:hypothetical protein
MGVPHVQTLLRREAHIGGRRNWGSAPIWNVSFSQAFALSRPGAKHAASAGQLMTQAGPVGGTGSSRRFPGPMCLQSAGQAPRAEPGTRAGAETRANSSRGEKRPGTK